jgi:hypothetical protein
VQIHEKLQKQKLFQFLRSPTLLQDLGPKDEQIRRSRNTVMKQHVSKNETDS